MLITAALLGLSLIRPRYPTEQLLQHVPTVLALALLAWDARRGWLSAPSFGCAITFLWLHILGARYIYSYVPYDQWSATLCGCTLSQWFGWERNHYDRLVHFCFGSLCLLPATELALSRGQMTRTWALSFGLLTVVSIGAGYEIFEWLLTVFMSPQQAEAYNGQQGDFWDAQKDMTLALFGAVIALPWVAMRCHQGERGA